MMEFAHPVTAGVAAYIRETYGIEPEFLWAKTPNNAVFRHPDNRKWFAVLLTEIPGRRLGLKEDGPLDILDLKCDPKLIGSLLEGGHCLPGYHMNKEHWITVLLDGSVPLPEVFPLIGMSFDITQK